MSTDYKLIYLKSAVKFITKQDKKSQERIVSGLRGLIEVPPRGDIKTMKGYSSLYRLRIGDYRVLFEINHLERIIYIQAIGNRGDIYG